MFAEEAVNNPTWLTIVISLGTLIGGVFGARIIEFIFGLKKQQREDKAQAVDLAIKEEEAKSKLKLSENEQAISLLKEILISVRNDVDTLKKHLSETEALHVKCREDNIALSIRLTNAEKEIEGLKAHVA
jgi:hypothetical protein